MADDTPSLATLETLVSENATLRSENSLLRMRVQALERKQVVPPQFLKVLSSLVHSRKVLVALLALGSTLALHTYGVDPVVWAAIDGVLIVLIGSISYEDGQEKGAAQTTIVNNSPTVTTEEAS